MPTPAPLIALLLAVAAQSPGHSPADTVSVAPDTAALAPVLPDTTAVPPPDTAAIRGAREEEWARIVREETDLPGTGGEVGMVQILDRPTLDRWEVATVGELVGRLAGATRLSIGPVGQREGVGIRGLLPSQTLIFLDGRLIGDPATASLDLALLPVEALERVEIHRGMAGIAWGGAAAAGAIHFITRLPPPGPALTVLSLGDGDLESHLFRGAFGRPLPGGLGLSLSATSLSTAGDRPDTDARSLALSVRLSAPLPGPHTVSLTLHRTRLTRGLGILPGGSDDPSSEQVVRLDWRLRYRGEGGRGIAWEGWLHGEGVEADASRGEGTATGYDASRWGARALLRWAPGPAWDLLAGVEGLSESARLLSDGEAPVDRTLWAGLGTVRWRTPGGGDLVAEWRRESAPEGKGALSARAALSRPLARGRLTPYVSAGRSAGSPLIAPQEVEVAREIEVGATASAGESLRLGGAFLQRREEGLLPRPVPVLIDSTILRAREAVPARDAWGWEIETTWARGGGWGARASYFRWADREGAEAAPFLRDGGVAALSHRRSFKRGELEWSGELAASYYGPRPGAAPGTRLPREVLVAATAELRVVDVTFFYAVEDLLAAAPEVVPGFPLPGRVGRFGFRWIFRD